MKIANCLCYLHAGLFYMHADSKEPDLYSAKFYKGLCPHGANTGCSPQVLLNHLLHAAVQGSAARADDEDTLARLHARKDTAVGEEG
jgi:hypothetical protein